MKAILVIGVEEELSSIRTNHAKLTTETAARALIIFFIINIRLLHNHLGILQD